MVLTNKLTAIADAIREKTGSTDKMTLDEMPTAISGITTGGGDSSQIPTDEELVVSGDCSYRFAYGGWNWFIEKYKDRIITKDITKADRMFDGSTLESIPFVINFKNTEGISMLNMFNGSKLKETPRLNIPNVRKSNLNNFIYGCRYLRDANGIFTNEEQFGEQWQSWVNTTEFSNHYIGGLLQGLSSLRSVPSWFYLFKLNPASTSYVYSSYCLYYRSFYDCTTLDEVKNIPVWKISVPMSKSMFDGPFNACNRLKTITFETNEDGTPIVADWKSQTIDMSSGLGWGSSSYNVTSYNSGITADKEVKNADTYAALKDDPDWFTTKKEYSRFNHDSAVETINSLPDTSAYLATAGGTNTVKFLGVSGSATDGGAINTLTEEEIAVATVKGWTVTFV